MEVLLALAVLAALLGLAAPSLGRLLARDALASAAGSLMADIRLARSEALRRGQIVSLCRTNSPDAAAPNCEEGTNWASGWLVFTNPNNNFRVDSSETILRIHPKLTGGASAEVTPGGSSPTTYRIGFRSDGSIVGLQANFLFLPRSGEMAIAQRVCVSSTGRTRVVTAGGECAS